MTPADTTKDRHRRLAIFVSFSGQGGVEKMLVNLLHGLLAEGVAVDLLLARAEGPFVDSVPDAVNRIHLKAGHTAWCVPELARYLRRARPAALLAVKDRAIRAAVRARRLARVDTRVVGRLGTNLGASLAHQPAWRAAIRQAPMRRIYRHIDAVITVSEGVAADTHNVTGLSVERIHVVRNPVITAALRTNARGPSPHPWLDDADVPVVVGMGRLTAQKNFATLIRGFAELCKQTTCRLIICGEGPERDALERLIHELNLEDWVTLTGFVDNPAAVLARADLFVLSSRWEGSPNVLTEAMALGTPVVATDCPSGPGETLAGGRYGKLVPVGNADALARAMQETLEAPLAARDIRSAVSAYDVATATRGYVSILFDGR